MPSPPPPDDARLAELFAELADKVDRLDARLAKLEAKGLGDEPGGVLGDALRHGISMQADPKKDPEAPARPPAEHAPASPERVAAHIARITDAARSDAGRDPEARFNRERFEWMLGAKGLALVGMIVVVVGLGMFLKYAYDEGWLARISPLARCTIAAGFGAAMLAAGEVLRRRISPLASAGTTATGIAVIYASILSASKLYDLIGTNTTFVLLAGITTLGVLLGSLSNRVLLAVLSLLGAFLVPLLLASGEPSFVAMPIYLLSLLALGLVLAGWRGGDYAHVRRLAWWGTGILGTMWIGTTYDAAPSNVLVFVVLAWLATIGELVVSARFFKTLRDRTVWPDRSGAGFVRDDVGEIRFNPVSLLAPKARWLNSAFGVTAWAVISASVAIREINTELDWLSPLGFALASAAIAVLTLRLHRSPIVHLWKNDPSPRSALAAALVINASLLVVATIAMSLGGWAQVCTWAALGLAAAETARRLRFRAAGIFGFGLLAVATARLATIDLLPHIRANALAEPFGLYITSWSLQVLYVSIAFAAVAWRSRYSAERYAAANASLWLLAGTLMHPAAAADSLGPAWLALAASAAWLTTRIRMRAMSQSACVLAAIGMAVTLLGQRATTTDGGAADRFDLDPVPMCIALAAWVAFALIPGLGFRARTTFASLAIASGGIALASLHQTQGLPAALLALVIYSAALLFASKRLTRWSVGELVGALLLVITTGWVANRIAVGDAAIEGTPLANAAFLAALGATATWLALARRVGTLPTADDAPVILSELRENIATISLASAWLLLLARTSLDVLRGGGSVLDERSAQGAALSIWWSLYAVASVALGFRLATALRRAGLVLLGIVAAKVLLFDTHMLQPPARITAAISVGLVIIGAGVLYARLIKLTEETDQSGAETPIEPGPS